MTLHVELFLKSASEAGREVANCAYYSSCTVCECFTLNGRVHILETVEKAVENFQHNLF